MNSIIKKIRLHLAKKYADNQTFKKELEKIKYGESGKKRMTMGKKLTIFLLINFTIVELYSLYIMYKFMDLSALPSLITVVIGEVVALITYQLKSCRENSANGITYELAMRKDDDVVG